MLRIIRLLPLIFIPFVAFAQINTSIINPVQTKIKILSVADNVISEDNYSLPDSGNKFISVKVLLDKTNSNSIIYSSFFDFKLIDSNEKFFKPSIKSFVVRKPYLVSNEEKKFTGWVTFEVPKKLSINSLQIKYEKSNNLCSDWIPLWPVVSNVESTKNLKRQVIRENVNSSFQTRQLLLKKILQSINNYLNYTATNQTSYFISGIQNATQAKLLIEPVKKTLLKSARFNPLILSDIITLLSEDLPENIMKRQSVSDFHYYAANLKKLREVVIKNYILN